MFLCLSKPKELQFKELILELTSEAQHLNLTEIIDLVIEKTGIKKN
jgi:hypothetical protein